MPVRQSPPGGRKAGTRLHFCYTPTDANKPWNAHVAGPCVWFDSHCKGKTKVCVHAVTGGELVCERCSPMDTAEPTGFQPLWRELDGKPVFVIVHPDVREAIDALRHRSRVLVGRGSGATDGVYITPPLKPGSPLQSTLREKMEPQDVTASVFRVMKIPALTEWYARETGVLLGGCNTPAISKPVQRIVTPPDIIGEGQGGPIGANELFVEMVRRATSGQKADERTALDPPAEPKG